MSKINLDWHIVAGSLEMEEFIRYKVVDEHEFKDARHSLFRKIKHPGMLFYKGGWGPEILMWPSQGGLELGRPAMVYATAKRAKQIEVWIQENLHNVIPD